MNKELIKRVNRLADNVPENFLADVGLIKMEGTNNLRKMMRHSRIPRVGTYCYQRQQDGNMPCMIYIDESNQQEIDRLWNKVYFESESAAINYPQK